MPRYIVSEQLKDGSWYGRGSCIAASPEDAIAKVKRITSKRHENWKAKIAKKASMK